MFDLLLQAYAGHASACDNFLQPARKLSQVLVSLVYKSLQVVTSGPVDLRKLMQAYAGWVMLGQVRVMLGQVGSCWDRSESCLCVTTFWPVPYCDFDHVRVMLSTCFALFLIVIWCVTTFYLVPYCDFDHVPT